MVFLGETLLEICSVTYCNCCDFYFPKLRCVPHQDLIVIEPVGVGELAVGSNAMVPAIQSAYDMPLRVRYRLRAMTPLPTRHTAMAQNTGVMPRAPPSAPNSNGIPVWLPLMISVRTPTASAPRPTGALL